MELKNIDQIGEGLVVFMPSGIQATLTTNEDKVIVEYPEMYKDEYTHEDFKQLIEEGIFIFNEPSIVMESVEELEEQIDEAQSLMQKIEECAKDSILTRKHTLHKEEKLNEGVMDKLKGFIRESLVEAYSQEDCEPGSVYTAMKDKEKEYVTAEFKNEALTALTKIAKEFPNVHVRQQAVTFMDELGLQEYYDLEAVRKFIDENLEKLAKYNTIEESYCVPKKMGKTIDKIITAQRLGMKDKEEEAKKEYQELKKELKKDESLNESLDLQENEFDAIVTHMEVLGCDICCYEWYDEDEWEIYFNYGEEHYNYCFATGDLLANIDPDGASVNLEIEITKDIISMSQDEFDSIMLKAEEKAKEIANSFDDEDEYDEEDFEESLNEEYGPFKGNIELQVVAKELANGKKSGQTGDLGNWICETSLDQKWETLSLDAKEYILEKISFPVNDGHIYYDDLELVLHEGSLEKQDMISLDLFEEDEIKDLFDGKETELCAYIWYEIKFDGTIDEGFKVKKKSKKKIADSVDEAIYLKDDKGNEEGPFIDQEAKEEFLATQKENGNNTEYEEVIKENIEDNKMQTNVKEFYCDKYPTDELGKEINPEITFEDVINRMKDGQNIYDILGCGDSVVRERVFDAIFRATGVELYDLWLNNGLNECINEEHYKVYNTVDTDAQPATFLNWDEVDEYLNRTWGEYKASMAKENAEFGTEQDKDDFLANFEVAIEPITIAVDEIPAEGIELPVADDVELTPEEEIEAEQVEQEIEAAAEEIAQEEIKEAKTEWDICKDMEKDFYYICNDTEVYTDDDGENIHFETREEAEEFLKQIQEDFEDEHIGSMEHDEEQPIEEIPAETEEPTETEEPAEIETPEQAKELIDKIEDDVETMEDYIKTLLDEEPTEQNEDFVDTMGMTDVKDLDMPDAIADTIDAKEDGTLYKLSDLAKEIEDLKATLKSEIESIKNDIKTALQDVKQDIKVDVNDVENKVDDTKDAVDDLTVEEKELEATEEVIEEPVEKTEEEKEEEAYEESLQGNKVYEACKEVLSQKKMSLTSLAESLYERGIKADLKTAYGKQVFKQVADMVSHTSLKESILSPEEESRLEKNEKLGRAAKWLGTGILGKMFQEKENQKYEEIHAIKQEIDKMEREGKDAKAVKDMITLKADNEQEQKEAEDYAVSKMAEAMADENVNSLKHTLLSTASTAKLNEMLF